MKKLIIIFVLAISFTTYAQSEIPELVTDRPDQTESAVVVPIGSYQIETGISYQNQKFSEAGTDLENQNLSLLNTLVRYGVNSNLEVRLGGGYFSNLTRISNNNSTIQGFGDLMIGAKYIFRKDEKLLTNFGILFETLLPFGSEQLRPENFEPKLLLLFEQELSDNFGLGINLGSEYSSAEQKYYYDYTATVGIDFTKRIGGFVEFYGQTAKKVNSVNYFDCGLTYLQSPNVQFDVSAGTIANSGIHDFFISCGFSIRFLN